MKHNQIGRNVFLRNGNSKYDIKLNVFRELRELYYKFRISRLDKRIEKLGGFSDYRMDRCNAAIYEKQAYLHKIESLYSLQELRDYERRVKYDDGI